MRGGAQLTGVPDDVILLAEPLVDNVLTVWLPCALVSQLLKGELCSAVLSMGNTVTSRNGCGIVSWRVDWHGYIDGVSGEGGSGVGAGPSWYPWELE